MISSGDLNLELPPTVYSNFDSAYFEIADLIVALTII